MIDNIYFLIICIAPIIIYCLYIILTIQIILYYLLYKSNKHVKYKVVNKKTI